MSRNSGSKYANKVKSIIDSNLMSQKTYANLVLLQFNLFVPQCDLSVLQSNLSMHVVFQIESKANSLLCSKFVVIFLVLPSIIVHLFADLLLFAPMTTTLM